MKEEIIGGLRNALDRGESIEKAMQSFINAGYSAAEVREAAGMINPSATSVLYGQPSPAGTSSGVKAAGSASTPNAPTTPSSSTPTRPVSPAPTQPSGTSPQPATKPSPAASSGTTQPAAQPSNPAKGKKTAILLASILILLVIALLVTLFFSGTLIETFFPAA